MRHLVYLDAFVPADGDTVAGLAGQPGCPGALEDFPEIATNHMVPVNRPGELAGLLLDLA